MFQVSKISMKSVKVRRNRKAAAEDVYILCFPIQHQHNIFFWSQFACIYLNKNYNIQILDALDIP